MKKLILLTAALLSSISNAYMTEEELAKVKVLRAELKQIETKLETKFTDVIYESRKPITPEQISELRRTMNERGSKTFRITRHLNGEQAKEEHLRDLYSQKRNFQDEAYQTRKDSQLSALIPERKAEEIQKQIDAIENNPRVRFKPTTTTHTRQMALSEGGERGWGFKHLESLNRELTEGKISKVSVTLLEKDAEKELSEFAARAKPAYLKRALEYNEGRKFRGRVGWILSLAGLGYLYYAGASIAEPAPAQAPVSEPKNIIVAPAVEQPLEEGLR